MGEGKSSSPTRQPQKKEPQQGRKGNKAWWVVYKAGMVQAWGKGRQMQGGGKGKSRKVVEVG